MKFFVIAICISFFLSGIPCPHVVHAMEMDIPVAHVDDTAKMADAMHAVGTASVSTDHGVSPRTDDSCCINVSNTSTEADQIQSAPDGGVCTTAVTEITGASAIHTTIETHHPPDLQSPYHKRTTCQRE